MTDLPRIEYVPTPKFSIGQKVFVGYERSVTKTHPCPDCLGIKKWKIITPAGMELEAACQRCGGYNGNDLPSLNYQSWEPVVEELTVGSIQINTAPHYDDYISYMCTETGIGSGSVYAESLLCATHKEAQEIARQRTFLKINEGDKKPEAITKKHFSYLTLIDANLKLAHDMVFDSWWAYRHLREDMNGFLEGTTTEKDLRDNIEWTLSYDDNHRSAKALFELIIARAVQTDDEELKALVAKLPHKPIEKKSGEIFG